MFPDMQTIPTAVGAFQAQFGAPPGSQDAQAECDKWQRLCAELLLERERLRTALAKEQLLHERAVLRLMCMEVQPNLTMEQVYAQVDRESSLDQIIADLKRERETVK